MKDYLEPTFVVIFNLEAAVKISLLGWNTYRKFSRLATSGHFIVTSGITGMIYFLFWCPAYREIGLTTDNLLLKA